MKKVGILSMQRIFNYGSFLQAYGLKSILNELGCDVEFVDYHPGKCLVESVEGHGVKRKIIKVVEVLLYKAPLKEKIKFIKYKKEYAQKYFPMLGIDNNMNYSPKLDMLVIGSDEVFNCVQNNTNVGFSPELFGEGNCANRVITYAASCGNTTVEKIEQYGIGNKLSMWFSQMDAISVRDNNTKNVVESLSERKVNMHFDPVLVYDYVNKCDLIPRVMEKSNYLILYGYSGRFTNEECKQIRQYAKRNNLKIYCIGGVQNCCDKFIDCSPFEVISYFKGAQCVVTDTFHGTILSVITHSEFVSIVRNTGYGNSEKLTDLLKKLDLNSRIISDMKLIDEFMEKKIQYELVDNIISEQRRLAYDYLRNEVKMC